MLNMIINVHFFIWAKGQSCPYNNLNLVEFTLVAYKQFGAW